MTSVPKPLKFLRAHYPGMKAVYERMPPSDNRKALADVLSVLAMNSGAEGARESLHFRLAGSSESVGAWGHEYVRCAAHQRDRRPLACRLCCGGALALRMGCPGSACAGDARACAGRAKIPSRPISGSHTAERRCRRHVAGEIGPEWQERVEAGASTDDLLVLVHQIVPFHMAHNAEPEAVDLLLEVPALSVETGLQSGF